MTDTITHSFLHLLHPDLALARAFNLPARGIVHAAIRLVFDRYEDLHHVKGRTNLPAAYNESADYIEGSLILFNRYAPDYTLSPRDRETALTAWLCQNCIDPVDPATWDMIGPDALAILMYLDKDENTFPRLSDTDHDPPLALNIGLTLWTHLSHRLDVYRAGTITNDLLAHDADIDRHHAFMVLNDRPALQTALSDACQAKAKEVIDSLRGRAPGRHVHLV